MAALPRKAQVLIVGGGPVGMASAITLAQEGVQDVVLVDASTTNINGCRSGLMHANTLESLDTIGVADAVVAQAHCIQDMRMFSGTTQVWGMPFQRVLSPFTKYPFIAAIEQHKTEHILRKKLDSYPSVQVHRGKRVVGLSEVAGGILVQFEDGEVLTTKYLVGADGSRSMVRTAVGLAFNDPHTGFAYDSKEAKARGHRMVLADIELIDPPKNISNGKFAIHFIPNSLLVLIPLPSPHHMDEKAEEPSSFYRAVIYLRQEEAEPDTIPDTAYVQQLLATRNPYPTESFTLKNVHTASRYNVRTALVDKFYVPFGDGGHVVLAGDAAHVHAPAGGQGLNLGFCDAIDLGRAISAHIRSPEDIVLERYSARRKGIGQKVIGLAVALASMNTGSLWKGWLRNAILYIIWKVPMLQLAMAMRLSGLVHRK